MKKWQNSLLDINPEGDLLREIKDIMDELFIMTLIKIQEETVARTFVKHVQRLLQAAPSGGGDNSIDDRSDISVTLGNRPARLSSSHGPGPRLQINQQGDLSEDANWTMTCAREYVSTLLPSPIIPGL